MARSVSWTSALLLLACALPGCAGDPDPAPEDRVAGPERPRRVVGKRVRPGRTARRPLRTSQLLPVPRDKVLWYRASFPSADPPVPPRQVAMFTVRDPEAGRFLETVGLGESRLRLIRRAKQIWLVPATSGRASLSNPTVIYELGEAARTEALVTALGRVSALRVDRQEDGLTSSFWFAQDLGLVQHELSNKGAPVFRLELLAILPRGRPDRGYDRTKPERMWNALQEAIRRLDVESLPGFFTRKMQARLGGPDWESTSRLSQVLRRSRQPRAERIRRMLPDLLDVRFKLDSDWTTEGDKAEALAKLEARLGRALQSGTAVLELLRGPDGLWRWDGFRRSAQPEPAPPEQPKPGKQ